MMSARKEMLLCLNTHYDKHGTFKVGRMALLGEVRESYKEGKFRTIALVVKLRNLTILENLQAHGPRVPEAKSAAFRIDVWGIHIFLRLFSDLRFTKWQPGTLL